MTVPEAIQVAKKHLVEIMPDLASAEIELEELETPPHGSKWRFTFTAVQPFDYERDAPLRRLLKSRRSTKSVEVDSTDGSLLAIRNQAA